MSRGISRIYDAIIACTIILIGCSAALALVPPSSPERADDLDALAMHILSYLDEQHALGYIVYSRDSGAAVSAIGGLLPSHLAFSLGVYDAQWALLWSVESQLGDGAGSASYYLSGANGTLMPTIVVLQISR